MKLSAEQKIERAHVWLMNSPKYCLYSGVFMIGKTEVRDDMPTAATNGRDAFYGRKFVDKLSEQELRGLILHENLHKVFRHLTVWKALYKENAQIANMACDYVINLMIVDSDPEGKDVKLPEGGCYDVKYRGMDEGTVYRLLTQNLPPGGGGSGNGGGGESLDHHDWDDAEEMSEQDKITLSNNIDQALRQGKILAGRMSGDVPRSINDVLKSRVDWREAMREFITSTCADRDESTWRRPARRWIAQDVYMPSSISERMGILVCAIDMSGSIGTREVAQFIGNLVRICETVKPEEVHLMYWDTRVCAHEVYKSDQYDSLLSRTKPAGGGGTDPQCIVDYMKGKRIKADCAVILTDGYVCSWGEGWDCPTLWGITSQNIESKVGKSVHIGGV